MSTLNVTTQEIPTISEKNKKPEPPQHNTLLILTTLSLCATIALDQRRPLPFYRACAAFQITTIAGILTNSSTLIQTGHLGFGLALLVGAATLPSPDVLIIFTICAVTLLTRKIFNGCLFDLKTDTTYTHCLPADAFYLTLLIVSFARSRHFLFPQI